MSGQHRGQRSAVQGVSFLEKRYCGGASFKESDPLNPASDERSAPRSAVRRELTARRLLTAARPPLLAHRWAHLMAEVHQKVQIPRLAPLARDDTRFARSGSALARDESSCSASPHPRKTRTPPKSRRRIVSCRSRPWLRRRRRRSSPSGPSGAARNAGPGSSVRRSAARSARGTAPSCT